MSKAISKAIINYRNSLNLSVNTSSSLKNKDNTEAKDVVVKPKIDSKNNSGKVIFKIQIAASSNSIETKSFNFKNLSPISREKEGSLYRYFFGETDSYNKAKKMKTKAIRKGYEYAFIVAFRDNKKIKLSTVIPK